MGSEKDADKMMREAEKALKPSVVSMRLRPKWDEAYPLFEKAALQYKLLGLTAKAMLAYEKAAEANLRGGGTAWHAGKHLEAAARCAAERQEQALAVDLFRRAAEQFCDAGKIAAGAEALGNGARLLESSDHAASGSLYKDALQMYSRADLSSMAHDVAQRGVAAQVRAGAFDDAAAMLIKWAAICAANDNNALLCKAALGAVVVYMHMGDARQAWATYQDYLEVEAFSNSPEAFAAENLMQAYASGKADYVRQAVRQGRSWNALDGQVARLAKALPSQRGDLKEMATFLREMLGDDAPQDADGDDAAADKASAAEDDLDLT